MFLLDDLLLKPIFFIAKEVQKKAEEELLEEKSGIREELVHLYKMWEGGEIKEEELEAQEEKLLIRLEELEEVKV